MRGLMQEQPLVVSTILEYAAKVHGEQVRTGVPVPRSACEQCHWEAACPGLQH